MEDEAERPVTAALRGPDVKRRCGLYLGRVLVSVPRATPHGG